MAKFRADIRVISDVVLPPTDASIQFELAESQSVVMITNAPAVSKGVVEALNFAVVSDCDSIENVASLFREKLRLFLDSISYILQAKFRIVKVWRVIEWEPHKRTRAFKCMEQFDANYPPSPVLLPRFVSTASALVNAGLPRFIRRALECYRYGLIHETTEEKFMAFWTAIEVIAEQTKSAEKVPIPCATCRANLYCLECKEYPLRRPMANQAIAELVASLNPPDPDKVFKLLITVRTGIAHGSSRESIEKRAKQPLHVAVDIAGKAACHAIRKFIPASTFAVSPTFAPCREHYNKVNLIVGPSGDFDCDPNEAYPAESIIPMVEIETVV